MRTFSGNSFGLVLVLISLLTVFGLTLTEVFSFDIFWQLQSGKYMWETGSILRQDTFSLASEVGRIEHCWLHDVVVYLVWKLGGYPGISFLKAGLVTLTAALLMMAARIRGASWWAILAVAPWALLQTRGGWQERPQLWTFLGVALFLYLYAKARTSNLKFLWFLVPVTLLWANLHGGAVLAFPLFLAFFVGELLHFGVNRNERSAKGLYLLLAVSAVAGAAACLTPYGAHLFDILPKASSLGASSGVVDQVYNQDWRNTDLSGWPNLKWSLVGIPVLFLLNWRSIRWAELCVWGGLAIMSLKLERHQPIYFFALVALLPPYLTLLGERLSRIKENAGLQFALRLRPLAAIAVTITLCWVTASSSFGFFGFFEPGLRSFRYPDKAASFVLEQQLPGNLFNSYEWGGFLMWRLFPDYKVFFDGRQISRALFQDGLDVSYGKANWQEVFARHAVKTAVILPLSTDNGGRFGVVNVLRDSPDWALVYAEASTLVFVKRSEVSASWLLEYERPNTMVDDVVFELAGLFLEESPARYRAHWELAKINYSRELYREAFVETHTYLSAIPLDRQLKAAQNLYRSLYPIYGKELDEL